ncbi:unnamed protein product [Rangifer tarandus platyrhynchus]|uniref:Uncharacterized protein n=1 Tax=Rangifer tarandus platyrhynchus TaxID=3082113 RepID=A0AC59ZVI4_RANTA
MRPVTGIRSWSVAPVRGVCGWVRGSGCDCARGSASRGHSSISTAASAPRGSSAPQQLNSASSLDQTGLGRHPAADSRGKKPCSRQSHSHACLGGCQRAAGCRGAASWETGLSPSPASDSSP